MMMMMEIPLTHTERETQLQAQKGYRNVRVVGSSRGQKTLWENVIREMGRVGWIEKSRKKKVQRLRSEVAVEMPDRGRQVYFVQ